MEYSTNNRVILAITEEDVIGYCLDRQSGWTEEDVRNHMRSFQKGLEWGVMDHIWESIEAVASDIEHSRG